MNELAFPEIDPEVLATLPPEFAAIYERTPTGRAVSGKHAQLRVTVKAVCILLAFGWPVAKISDQLGCTTDTVYLIQDRFAAEVSKNQQEFGKDAFKVAWKLRHHVESNIDKMTPYQAAIAFGILTDKGLLLTGQPTAIVEARTGASAPETLVAWFKSQAIDVDEVKPLSEGNTSDNSNYGSLPASPAVVAVQDANRVDSPKPKEGAGGS